ncbi:hypothetical protein Rleg10DRAFT_3573 [Rhizobium leguminosarum bv. trifolii WSM2012]|nr:hypothetical protein Rleg10DRAFT_3573 [Rhizobium leguminosarum bv. trifolii WSM2012]
MNPISLYGRNFVATLNTDDLTIVVSARRQFTAHLLPDLQSVEDQLAALSPERR